MLQKGNFYKIKEAVIDIKLIMGKKEVTCLSSVQYKRLFKVISEERSRLILQVLYETGCTVNELVHIKVSDVDFEQNSIKFPSENTKTHKSRVSCVSKELIETIDHYIKHGLLYLFSTRQSGKITTKRVRQLILSFSKKANLPKVTPQIIRYTHIAHALRKGIPLVAIQKQIGMERLRMVQIYEALVPEEKDNAYSRFWLNE